MSNKKNSISRDTRSVAPVIGVILVVAVAVVLATLVFVFGIGFSEDVSDATPVVGFEVDTEDGAIVLIHNSGDVLDGETLEVIGAKYTSEFPDTISSGDRLYIVPEDDVDRVTLNYIEDGDSATLKTINPDILGETPVNLVTADGRLLAEGLAYDGQSERPIVRVTEAADSDWLVVMDEEGTGDNPPETIEPGDEFDPVDIWGEDWDDEIPASGEIVSISIEETQPPKISVIIADT